MTQPNHTSEDKLHEAALKAIKATNFCTRHTAYHGQKYKNCTPQERVMITLKTPSKTKGASDEGKGLKVHRRISKEDGIRRELIDRQELSSRVAGLKKDNHGHPMSIPAANRQNSYNQALIDVLKIIGGGE